MTRDTVTVVADIPEVRYIPANGKRGPAAARNCGWRAARGDIIAFTDDDCLPDPEWLRSGVQAIQNGHDGAYGRVIVPLPNHPTDYEKDTLGLERSEFITANCFYHRSVLAAAGGIRRTLYHGLERGQRLVFQTAENGLRSRLRRFSAGVPPVRPARWAISIHQQKKAMFNALLYKKHARLYRAKIQRRPPWHYYLATAGLAAVIAGIIAQYSLVGWLGLLTWLLSTAAFCLIRLKGTSKHLRHIAEMVATSVLIPPLAVFWRLRGALKFKVFFI
jgi:glycosyltransferase involved in cell wall biosynthesis